MGKSHMVLNSRDFYKSLVDKKEFFDKFRNYHQEFYEKSYLDEDEGEKLLKIIHQEFKNRGVEDPLYDLSGKLCEDFLMSAKDNVVIGLTFPFLPPIMQKSDLFEIVYVQQSDIWFYTASDKILLREGDILIVPPNVTHCIKVDWGQNVFTIKIRSSTFDMTFFNHMNKTDILAEFFNNALYSIPTTYLLWHGDENITIKHLVKQMYDEFMEEKPYYNRMLEVLMSEFFLVLLREETSIDRMPEISKRKNEDTVYLVMDYIAKHLADANIGQAALLCNYSERQLTRILKNEINMTFLELRQQFRLKKACMLLRSTDIATKKIAKILGFSNDNYLTKVFFKQYGMTPTEYRKAEVV